MTARGIRHSPLWALLIPKTLFPEMLQAIPSMTQRVVSTLLDRVREVTRISSRLKSSPPSASSRATWP